MATDARGPGQPSLASLVGGIVSDFQDLTKQQFNLFRSEVKAELKRMVAGLVSMGVGAGLAALGGLLLVIMLVHLLDYYTDIPLWGCYGIVGGVVAAAGAALLLFGTKEVKDVELAPPPQTAETLKENLQWLKGQAALEAR
jgi:hypothetical protein